MSSNTAINNDGNIVNSATRQNIETQNNYFGPPKKTRRRSDRQSIFMVPSTLTDDEFVGHQALLDTVSRSIRNNHKVALYGLGGVGTSRLAAEVGKKLHRNTFSCVFWVDAKNVTNFMRGMECIAVALELPPTADAASHANAAKSWMETYSSGSWLLILDAAGPEAVSESHEFSVDSKENNFVQRLPQRSSSPLRTILITTSEQHVALKWSPHPGLAFEVPFLNLEDAASLLRRKSGDQSSKDQDVISLTKELDGNPSAILAAAALVRIHGDAGESISTFLATGRKEKDRFIAFFDGTHPLTHALHETSVTVTWVRAIEKVQERSRKACDLLFLIACLDGTSISPDLFCNVFGWESDSMAFRTEVSTLLNHRLISRDKASGCYRMPKLVRLTTRHWMKTQYSKFGALLAQWHLKALDSLLITYDSMHPGFSHDKVKTHLEIRALLPHAVAFQQFCRNEGRCTVRLQNDQFRAIVVFAELFSNEGRYKGAEDMLGFARESPVDHANEIPWRKVAMLRLAESLRNQTLVDGRSKRLKTALRIVREVEEAPEGVEIDLWSTSALLLADKGKFSEATEYQDRVVDVLTEIYGSDSPRTLEARLELSQIRWRKGDVEEALEEQKQIEGSLQAEQLEADPDNVSRLLHVQAALVRTHYSLDDLHTAVALAEKVVEGRTETFGNLDMKTISSEKDLAQCLFDLNRKSEAAAVFKRVEEKLQQKFDFNHTEVRGCVGRLDGIHQELSTPGGEM